VFPLGHLAMGYLFAWAVAKGMKRRVVVWAALTAGILPDYDILFSWAGLAHHTYTHSLVVMGPILLVVVLWKRGALPYAVAVLQHILIGDTLVGRVPLLLPLSRHQFGLNLGMPSVPDISLELGFAFLALLVMWLSGDLRRVFAGGKETVLMAVPIVSVALMALLWRVTAMLEEGGSGFSRLRLFGIPVVQAIYVGVGVLVAMAAFFVLLGLFRHPHEDSAERRSQSPPGSDAGSQRWGRSALAMPRRTDEETSTGRSALPKLK